MRCVAIIPARYASTRFPGKPLALLHHKPLIWHVYERVKQVIDNVYVATDDERIYDAVTVRGGKALMTIQPHKSGTDRCYEAYTLLDEEYDVVLNIQGDEPFVCREQLEALIACFADPKTTIATLVKPFSTEASWEELASPNTPKVVVNKRMEALYFSRSVVPYLRGVDRRQWTSQHTFFQHIGMYAFKSEVLRELTQLPVSELESCESLEQLRWIENGYSIKVGITHYESIGIDTPDDLEHANSILAAE